MNPSISSEISLTPERLHALRRSIDAGDYDSPAVAEAVARRILARDDLRGDARDELARARTTPFSRDDRDDRDDTLIH